MQNPTLYFSDGKRIIDYVLVYKHSDMTQQNKLKLDYFLDSLLKTGLNFETEPFTEEENTIFVKINAPREIVIRYSDICDIDLAFRNKHYRPSAFHPFRFLATPLTLPNPEDEVYRRAPDTVSGNLTRDVTNAEKIMVVDKILRRTKYGDLYEDYGLRKLLKAKVFNDAFPLHEGPYEWTNSGPLTDRQLLAEFWGSPKCWYKKQPSNLIEKYYGTEVAFYFAWLGFYVKLLLPAAALSIACVLYGVLTMLNPSYNFESADICSSQKLMCPRCHYRDCKYEKLSNSCIQSYITYVHDNPATILFAVITAFWSTIFIGLWERKQAVLQIRWNVKSLEHDTSMRPGGMKIYPIAFYCPRTDPQVIIMILAMFAVMAYRIIVDLILIRDSEDEIIKENTKAIASITGSMISACLIVFFKEVCRKIALCLTDIENHRTQTGYDNAFIYKSYALEFTNNYSAVFYIAFFKGRFYTHPGDMTLWSTLGGLGSDICDPTGCIMDLSIQLMAIMIVKIFLDNIAQIVVPILKGFMYRKLHHVRSKNLPLYGTDFLLVHTDRYFLLDEYMDMVIQYGFVVFFVAGFPLAPFLALINNFIEIRVDSYKLTRSFRRPVPRKVTGLGAWSGILKAITYVGVAINAVVLAFNSDFISKLVYWYKGDADLPRFIDYSLSAYSTEDFAIVQNIRADPLICYYPGSRYPPDHPEKYELTSDYWFVLAMRFLVVAVFEHVIMSLKGILAYSIPSVPAHVTEELAIQERKNKEARMRVMKDELIAQSKMASWSTTAPLDLD